MKKSKQEKSKMSVLTRFFKFSKKSTDELLQDPAALDMDLYNYFLSLCEKSDISLSTFAVYKSSLKKKFLELSNGELDISNANQFPSLHVRFWNSYNKGWLGNSLLDGATTIFLKVLLFCGCFKLHNNTKPNYICFSG